MAGTFYRFVYMRPYPGSMLMPHQQRDGDAAVELMPLLIAAGLTYGDAILNYPPGNGFPPDQVDTPEMGASDLLVLTTRPPLNDREEELRKQVPRSYTDLEEALFRILRASFTHSSRKQVELRKALASRFDPGYCTWADTSFSVYVRATTEQWFAACTGRKAHGSRKWHKPAGAKSTAAYLAITPPIRPEGPRLLCVFGMTATETLAWCRLLRKGWWERLRLSIHEPRFVMVELTPGPLPARPDHLGFTDSWGVKILLDAPYPQVDGAPEDNASSRTALPLRPARCA